MTSWPLLMPTMSTKWPGFVMLQTTGPCFSAVAMVCSLSPEVDSSTDPGSIPSAAAALFIKPSWSTVSLTALTMPLLLGLPLIVGQKASHICCA